MINTLSLILAVNFGTILAIALPAVAVVALVVAFVCITVSKKNKRAKEETTENEKTDEKVNAAEHASEIKSEEQVKAPAREEKTVTESVDDGEEKELESEIAEEFDDDYDDANAGMSLKESLALAAAHALIKINKKSVADWLEQNYGEDIKLNQRKNKTKTGLPLADTHYVVTGAKSKCFVYVYELDEEKSMLLLKTDDETAKEISEKYPSFLKSRFPKSRREHWYTLIPDSGFNSADEVFDVVALVLAGYTENLRKVSAEVRREIARLEELKKRDVTAEEARVLVSDAAADALVTGRRHRRSGKKFAVNIDTLSNFYEEEDTVDMESLKSRGIVPKSAKQVKILARGTLDKPLTVIADDFSADAVKMIVLTGGEALWS